MNNSDIEARVQQLECRLNRYRMVSIALGLGLVGLAGIAANAPRETSQEIRTHKIVVVDDKGKEMVHLLTGVHGGVLNLFNSDGIPILRAGASDKGAKNALADPKGEQFLELTSEDTGGQLVISDKKGGKNLMRATPGRLEK